MKIHNAIQGSAEWHRLRLGKATASRCADIITPGRLQLSKSRGEYMHELLGEWSLGTPQEDFLGNAWTERGHELEAEAADYFRLQTDLEPVACGFIEGDDGHTGCSPDWTVDDYPPDGSLPDGVAPELVISAGVELKCPKRSTHIGFMLDGACPTKYVPQVQFSLWITKFEHWWFMSYYPGLPPVLVKVLPEERWQTALDEHVPTFIEEMLDKRQELIALGVVPALDETA